jgi:DNA repair exonuclease SbcCD ATPase subunit
MRIARVVVLLWLAGAVTAAGCKDRGDASAAPDPAALKAQQELTKRRDALLEQRQRLEGQRKLVLEEIQKAEASGGDTKALAKQRDDLTAQIDGQSAELGQMSDKLSSLSTKLDSAAEITAREDRMSQREGRVATREAAIGERERALASREEKLAQREKETCGTAPPMIIQTAKVDGKYGKADVQPLLARARATMTRKGVLVADLPGPAQGLEGESTRAMADGDWGKAYFAAAQLVAMVDAVKIDRAFIQAKTARLSSQIKASKPDETTNQQLSGVLSDVMQKYNDGAFGAANQRLNQLAALLK